MAISAGEIEVLLSLRDEMSAALAKANGELGGFERSAEGASASGGLLGGVLGNLGKIAGGLAIGALAKDFIGLGGEISDLSAKTGLSTTELQRMKFAAEQTGGTMDGAARAVTVMSKTLAGGGDSAVAALSDLGLGFDSIRAMSPGQAFETIAGEIAKIPDPMKQSESALKLFGKSGADLLPMMKGDMKALGDQAEALGLVMSEDTVKGMDDLGDAIDALLSVGKMLIGVVLVPIAPLLTTLAQKAGTGLAAAMKLASDAVKVISTEFGKLSPFLTSLSSLGGQLGSSVLPRLASEARAFAAGLQALSGPILAAVSALGQSVWASFGGVVTRLSSFMADLGRAFVEAGRAVAGVLPSLGASAWGAFSSTLRVLAPLTAALYEAVIDVADALLEALRPLASSVWSGAVSVFRALSSAWSLGMDLLGPLISLFGTVAEKTGLWTGVMNLLKGVLALVLAPLQAAADAIGWLAGKAEAAIGLVRGFAEALNLIDPAPLPPVTNAMTTLVESGLKPMASHTAVVERETRTLTGTLGGATSATNAAKEAAKQHAEEIAGLVRELTGAGAIAKFGEYGEAVRKAGGLSAISAAGIDTLKDALDKALGASVPMTKESQALALEMMKLGLLEPPVARGLEDIAGMLEKAGRSYEDHGDWAEMLSEQGLEFNAVGSKAWSDAITDIIDSAEKLPDEAAPAAERFSKRFATALGIAGQAITDFGGARLGAALTAIGSAIDVIGDKSAQLGDKMVAGFSAAAQIVGQFAQASDIAAMAAGGLQGATAAVAITATMMGTNFSMAAGLAAAGVGFAIGAFVAFVQSAERAEAASRQMHAEAGKALRALKKDILDLYGSMEQVDRLSVLLGVNLSGAMLVGSGPEKVEELSRLMEELGERIEALMGSIKDNAGLASQQVLDLIAQLEKAGETAGVAADFIRANLTDAAVGLNGLLTGLAASNAAAQKQQLEQTFAATRAASENTIASYQAQLKQLEVINTLEAGHRRRHLEKMIEAEKAALAERTKAHEAALKNVQGEFVKTEQQAHGLASAVVGTFGEMIARGVSFREALAAVQPSINALRTELQRTGFDGGAAFRQLEEMSRIAGDAVMGPLVDAVAGARSALTGLHNSGLLNQDMFAGIASTASQAFREIVAQGGDGTSALAMMQPTLQTIWKLQQDFGYEVDEATQALLDQAVASGLVGAHAMTDAEKQTAALDMIANKMGELLDFFQRLLPAASESGSEKAASSLGKTETAVGNIGRLLGEPDWSEWGGQVASGAKEAGEAVEGVRDEVDELIDKLGEVEFPPLDTSGVGGGAEGGTASMVGAIRSMTGGGFTVQGPEPIPLMSSTSARAPRSSDESLARELRELRRELTAQQRALPGLVRMAARDAAQRAR